LVARNVVGIPGPAFGAACLFLAFDPNEFIKSPSPEL
jgi:hypothetical protein